MRCDLQSAGAGTVLVLRTGCIVPALVPPLHLVFSLPQAGCIVPALVPLLHLPHHLTCTHHVHLAQVWCLCELDGGVSYFDGVFVLLEW